MVPTSPLIDPQVREIFLFTSLRILKEGRYIGKVFTVVIFARGLKNLDTGTGICGKLPEICLGNQLPEICLGNQLDFQARLEAN